MGSDLETLPGRWQRLMWRRLLWPLAALLIISAGVAIFHEMGLARVFTHENMEAVEAFIERAGVWGPFVYLASCIGGVALMSPALPWIVLAAMFGVVRGIFLASIGITAGAGVCFLMARHTMRPVLRRLAGHTREFRKIEDGVKAHGWRMVMITRLVPLFPFNLQNYAYGLTPISFWQYLLVTWLCTLPAVIAYGLAAGALVSGRGDPGRILVYLGLAAVLLLVLSMLPQWIKRRASWAEREITSDSSNETGPQP